MLDQMRGRLASLSDEARTIRSQVPHEFEPDLERIQAQMQRLGERLSDLGRGAIVPYNAVQQRASETRVKTIRYVTEEDVRVARVSGDEIILLGTPGNAKRADEALNPWDDAAAKALVELYESEVYGSHRREPRADAAPRQRMPAAAAPSAAARSRLHSAAGALCVRPHRRHERHDAVGAARLLHGHQLPRPALCRNRRAHRAVARPHAPRGGAAFARQPLRRAGDAAQLGARPRRDARRSRRAARRRGADRGDRQPARSAPPPVGAPRRDRRPSRHADLAALRRAPVAPGRRRQRTPRRHRRPVAHDRRAAFRRAPLGSRQPLLGARRLRGARQLGRAARRRHLCRRRLQRRPVARHRRSARHAREPDQRAPPQRREQRQHAGDDAAGDHSRAGSHRRARDHPAAGHASSRLAASAPARYEMPAMGAQYQPAPAMAAPLRRCTDDLVPPTARVYAEMPPVEDHSDFLPMEQEAVAEDADYPGLPPGRRAGACPAAHSRLHHGQLRPRRRLLALARRRGRSLRRAAAAEAVDGNAAP